MELEAAIRGRRSVRAFQDRLVERDVLERLFELSRWAPSGMNGQPWCVTVLTGEASNTLVERFVEGLPPDAGGKPDLSMMPEKLRRRLEKSLDGMEAVVLGTGLEFEDIQRAGQRLYEAPVFVVVSYDARLYASPPPGVMAFATTMLLAAHDMGLATCWLGGPMARLDLIQEIAQTPEGEQVAAIIGLGYPAPASPLNAYRSPRDEVSEFVRWVEDA